MGERWSGLDECIAEQNENVMAGSMAGSTNQATPNQKFLSSAEMTSWIQAMDTPIAISATTSLVVMLMLLIIRPPFVYNRRRSRIHPDFYIETFSPFRLAAWTGIAGVVALVGSDVGRMYERFNN
jgi:hypothetical protein